MLQTYAITVDDLIVWTADTPPTDHDITTAAETARQRGADDRILALYTRAEFARFYFPKAAR